MGSKSFNGHILGEVSKTKGAELQLLVDLTSPPHPWMCEVLQLCDVTERVDSQCLSVLGR